VLLRQRSAVRPVIGYRKDDPLGDAMLAAAHYNFLELLGWLKISLSVALRAFLGKIAVERWKVLRTPTPKLPRGLLRSHDVNSSLRLRAISISSAGAFLVFLINPCSATNRPSLKQKSNRAIRPLGKSLRTSHRPPPNGRQSAPPIHEAAFASLQAPLRPVQAPVDPRDASEEREASGRRRIALYDSRKTTARPARSS